MKTKNLRWVVVTLDAIATVTNDIDRNALAVMWPGMSEDLGMGKEDYANIVYARPGEEIWPEKYSRELSVSRNNREDFPRHIHQGRGTRKCCGGHAAS